MMENNILQTIFWVAFTLTILFVLFKAFRRVPEANVKLVERLGRYNRTLKPGINLIIPFVESIVDPVVTTYDKDPRDPNSKKVQRRNLVYNGNIPSYEIIMDPPDIDAISKDNAIVYPDAILYFRIVDPVKAVYEIEDLGIAVYKLLETTLRQEIGVLDADEIIVGREMIGNAIRSALEEASAAWGTAITRVEIEEIRFEESVTAALNDQRAAELQGRAAVAAAEREKEAVIITAEGIKQQVVLGAEATFEKEKLEAEADYLKASRELEGQAKGTEALALALEKNPNAIVALEALKAQVEVAVAIGRSKNTLIIPEETAGLAGAIKSVQKILEAKLVGK
jgi:regulator of protease activity HflC (stomatin/prohibitin superfamily)